MVCRWHYKLALQNTTGHMVLVYRISYANRADREEKGYAESESIWKPTLDPWGKSEMKKN